MALPFEIELDVNSVVGLLNSNDDSRANFAPMVDDYKNLMNQILRWKLNHRYREANTYANVLAKMVVHLQQDFAIFDTPLVELSLLLLYSFTGLGCNHLCTETASMVHKNVSLLVNDYNLCTSFVKVFPKLVDCLP